MHFFSGCPQTWQSFQGLSLPSVIGFDLNFRFKKMLLVTVTSDVCNAVTDVIEGGESLFFLSFNILFNVSRYLNIVN